MIHLIVPFYDPGDAFDRCLRSICEQHSVEMTVSIIDDASTDRSHYDLAAKMEPTEVIAEWHVTRNDDNIGALHNIWNAIADVDPDPADIIVLLDGDDWLARTDSLAKIAAAYTDPDCWATYGSYVSEPPDAACEPALPYPPDVIRDRSFRRAPTLFNHPLSFKAFLWEGLDPEDCQFSDGTWMREIYDEAIMYPLLELAGPNHRCLTDTLYVYNSVNPLSVARAKRDAAEAEAAALRVRFPKPRLVGDALIDDDPALLISDTCKAHSVGTVVGTGMGRLAARVATWPWVERVATIEQSTDAYLAAVDAACSTWNVWPLLGESPEVIRVLVAHLPTAVWWLDAHGARWWESDTPVLDELFLILSRGLDDVILIDDARLYGRAPQFPSVDNLRGHIARIGDGIGREWEVTVVGDVIRVEP